MDNQEEEPDSVRKFDEMFSDTLLPSTLNNEYTNEEMEDPMVMQAIEESLRLWEHEKKMKRDLERIERENEWKEKKRREEEVQRTDQIRERLGVVISRLKTVFKNDPFAEDLLLWIEWECTPTHLLTQFRPKTRSSLTDLKAWIHKNLNPRMISLLEELSFF